MVYNRFSVRLHFENVDFWKLMQPLSVRILLGHWHVDRSWPATAVSQLGACRSVMTCLLPRITVGGGSEVEMILEKGNANIIKRKLPTILILPNPSITVRFVPLAFNWRLTILCPVLLLIMLWPMEREEGKLKGAHKWQDSQVNGFSVESPLCLRGNGESQNRQTFWETTQANLNLFPL